MLKAIEGNNITVVCNNCHKENIFDISEKQSEYEIEFEQYKNLGFDCPDCHTVEIFNMNIPVDDTDEPFETGDLTVDEEVQRHNVRLLMRMTRDDFTA